MAKAPTNIAASVRQKLLNLARDNERDFQALLIAFGLERLIYRLSISDHRDQFVLKGGMLVTLWTLDPGRFTLDADFLSFGESDEDSLKKRFAQILALDGNDGLDFATAKITAKPIRENQVYGGVRLRTTALLGKTQIPITIDIGFGDILTSPEYEIEYGSLLDLPSANIRAYSPATVIAEKFQAIVALGIVNGRMKDYYDIWAIPKAVDIPMEELTNAIRSTFKQRKTEIPQERPSGLSLEFSTDPAKATQWKAYAESTNLENVTLEQVSNEIWSYLEPICAS